MTVDEASVTTGEAAKILGVSRPQLIKHLEAGALAYQMSGSHRRIRLIDVLAYRDRVDEQARYGARHHDSRRRRTRPLRLIRSTLSVFGRAEAVVWPYDGCTCSTISLP